MVDIDVLTLSTFILDDLPYGLYFVDTERKILFWNKQAEKITGYSREEVIGRYCYDNILCHIDKDATPLCLTNCPVHATIGDGKARQAEVFLRHKESHRVSVIVESTAVYDEDGTRIGVVETFNNNSTKYYSDDLVDSLTNLVMTDKLTGLYNRRYAENYVESKILEVRLQDKSYGIAFMDLDDFGECNNVYGHDAGDKVLKTLTENIHNNLRDSDLLARWGGEEFIIIFPIKKADDILVVAEKVRETVESTLTEFYKHSINITASIGATELRSGDSVEAAITRADELMYESKKSGKNKATTDEL